MRLLCVGVLLLCSSASGAVLQGPVVNPSNGHTYYLLAPYETGVNSFDAIRAEAAGLGGDLTSIQDAMEDAWVFSTFGPTALASDPSSGFKSLLIGYTDRDPPGFVWTDGSSSTYTNWYASEPNGTVGDGEDYTGILLTFDPAGLWHDIRFESGDIVYGVVEVVPEPSTWVLGVIGLGIVALWRRK